MAELPAKGKYAPKRQKPSRLRHEVRPDSTEDERDRKKPIIQEPDSDTIVRETQLDDNGFFTGNDRVPESEHNCDNVPTSPSTAAILERLSVTRKARAPEHAPEYASFTFKPRTKEWPKADSASADSSSFTFTRSQPKKVPNKTLFRDEATAAESSTHTRSTKPELRGHDVQTSRDVTAMAEPAYVSQPHLSSNSHDYKSNAGPDQDKVLSHRPVTKLSPEDPGYHLSTQAETSFGIPSSAQPDARHPSAANKVRVVKKSQKGRKGQLSQQREGPQPPRSDVPPCYTQQAITTGEPTTETLTNTQGISQMDTRDGRVHASDAHAVRASAPTDALFGHAHVQESHSPMQEHGRISPDDESHNTTQTLPDTTFQDFTGSSAQREFPTSSVRVPSTLTTQLDISEPERQLSADLHDQVTGVTFAEEQVVSPAQESAAHTLSNNHEPVDMRTVSTRSHLLEVNSNNKQATPQSKDAETVLHGISHRDVPHRVVKPRRKLRPSRPMSHGLQEGSMSLSVEQLFENMRVAMLAEKYRAQHESTTTANQHQADIAELQSTINNQVQTIAERDESHRKLREALSQLTAKARNNQKFVTGLQQDYEKLQKSVTNFQEQSKKTLAEKTTELENEKTALYRDFEKAFDKLTATQGKTKSVLDDVYMRFVFSDSKRRHLAEQLSKQDGELKEERRKRDDMEKQLMCSVQAIPRQIVETSDALTNKFELLKTSLEKDTAHDNRDDQNKGLLDALQTLQMTPALTLQDIEKMESTLRLVHERLDSGLDNLSETVKRKSPPDTELQTFIKDQLHGLKTEMLKHEEATAESRQKHELNVSLKSQLEAQQQHSDRLEERTKELQQSEVDLKARLDQLKRELKGLRDAPPVIQVDTSELEREALDLRQQLEKTEEDLASANIKVESFERERNIYKGYYEDVKTQLWELQRKLMVEDDTAIREKITKDCDSKFAEKEQSFNRDIQQLTMERNEKDKALQDLSNKMNAADTHLDELGDRIRTLESEAVETTDVQKQLRQTVEELHAKDQDYSKLNREVEEKGEKVLELQGLHDKLQAQVTQQQTTIQTMLRDADNALTKLQQDSSSALQLLQDQVSTLQDEKKVLSLKLQQARINGDKLRQDAADLRAIKEADESRCQKTADEERRELAEQHRTEIDDWKGRLAETDASLKKSEADRRLAEDQHKAKIAIDHEKSESDMRKLENKYQDALRVEREQGSLNRRDASPAQVAQKLVTEPNGSTLSAKPRKKVNRHNQSALDGSHDQDHHSKQVSSALLAESWQPQLEDDDLFATAAETHHIPNNANSVDEEPGTVTESQDAGDLCMSKGVFMESLLLASRQESKRQASSSSSLSSLPPDEPTVLEETQPVSTALLRGISSYEFPQALQETQAASTDMLGGYVRDSYDHASANANAKVTPEVDNESVAGSQSSRSPGRPRSQANTASRMMPPPSNGLRHSQPSIGTHTGELEGTTRYAMYGRLSPVLGSSGTNVSDSGHFTKSSSRQSYSQHDPQRISEAGSQHGSSESVKQDSSRKRKSSIDQTEEDLATKKQRNRSQSRPLNPSSDLPKQSPYASGKSSSASRSKGQKTLLYTQASVPAPLQSKTPVTSSRVRGRVSRAAPSSGGAYSPRGQSSSQVPPGVPTRRSSTRLTRSQSRNVTAFGDAFNDRFSQELD